ncbi:hypothetical protein [Priestia koreensis]|uniref:hypothetical protein n=1 Tax=Priestia koreensis TaxID=284581 RepID=UPI00345AA0F7
MLFYRSVFRSYRSISSRYRSFLLIGARLFSHSIDFTVLSITFAFLSIGFPLLSVNFSSLSVFLLNWPLASSRI